MHRFVAVLSIVAAVLTAGCGQPHAPIQAGGSTFAYPLMSKWAAEYEKQGRGTLRYLSFGSGKGIEGMIDHSLDFGCTDAPMSHEELERARSAGGEVLHIPLALGAVVAAYNLEEMKQPLRFSGQVLAEIFLGKITQWDDPALKDLNPDVALPARAIHVCHRMDSSGTTYIWTEYLSKVNPQWQATVGLGKMVNWPVGEPANGNAGVAGKVKRTPGAIGYIELSYGLEEGMTFGSIQNREGMFITPTPGAITAAAEHALGTIPDDLRFSINNALGEKSYPVSGCVWAVLFASQAGSKGQRVVDFLRWTGQEGARFVDHMGYAPLPSALAAKQRTQLDRITVKP